MSRVTKRNKIGTLSKKSQHGMIFLTIPSVLRLPWTKCHRLKMNLSKFGFSYISILLNILVKKCHTAKFRGIYTLNIARMAVKYVDF